MFYKVENMSNEVNGKHLSPLKHPQQDFFIADIFDAISLQLDIASMEYPLFALKAGIKKSREFQQGNFSIKISPSVDYGLATIHDKDIWIYCISKLMQGIREGVEISRVVHFTIYDYLKTTNRGVSGEYYENTKNALDRLAGTRITTNIETANRREARGFGLIDAWKIVEEKDGRMIRVSVTLPEWLYRSIESKSVLTISPDYFRLRKPLDRRIYELARKHCGQNNQWTFNLDTLQKRTGSTSNLRLFRQAIRSLAKSNQLPDYSVQYNQEKDQVTFFNRFTKNEAYITESEFIQLGYGKDSYQTVIEALSQGKKIPKDLQEKYNVTDKSFIQAKNTASKVDCLKQSAQKYFVLDQAVIERICNTISKNIHSGPFMTEEVKQSMIKIEINEIYDQIANTHIVTDENKTSLSEGRFKEILYDIFNIPKA